MQFILDDDPKVNEQRLKDVRSIADNANTDGTCFAYGELFSLTETIEVLNYKSVLYIYLHCMLDSITRFIHICRLSLKSIVGNNFNEYNQGVKQFKCR